MAGAHRLVAHALVVGVADSRQQIADSRQQKAESRKQTADSRQQVHLARGPPLALTGRSVIAGAEKRTQRGRDKSKYSYGGRRFKEGERCTFLGRGPPPAHALITSSQEQKRDSKEDEKREQVESKEEEICTFTGRKSTRLNRSLGHLMPHGY
jgi:hypothetical protein